MDKLALEEIIRTVDTMMAQASSGSLQFQFAKMQMKQALLCKNQAEDYMKQIEAIQNEQELTAKMLSEARKLQEQAKKDNCSTAMSDEMKEFFKSRDLAMDKTGDDYNHTGEQWDVAIKSLSNYQENVGNKTQTIMVMLQDFMGQYNSFLEGCKSSIDQAVSMTQKINQAVR